MSVVIVLDCGATNLRAIAIDPQGDIVASHFMKNTTKQDENNSDFHIWDFEDIWHKLIECGQRVVAEVGAKNVIAFTVTTFGVDGAPFDRNGNQIYPIISWKCPRTLSVMKQVETELDRIDLYRNNGIGDYSFNTLYKLRWLKEYEPTVFKEMDKFVFISSMITHRLTSTLSTDYTMAGTSMMTDLNSCNWNTSALDYLGLSELNFPPLVMAGEIIGAMTPSAAECFGVKSGLPVVSAGHDTQFALIGSGAKENQAFLSSGTWEILMARSQRPQLNTEALENGVTVELDSVKGFYNPATQWLSSAVIEWVATQFFSAEKSTGDLYNTMIQEANEAGSGAGGVVFVPRFAPNADGIGEGAIEGLSIHTTRGQIVRAVFEGLSRQLKHRFDYLNQLCHLNDGPVVVVGGGTKNALWNQLKADALQRPLHIVEQAEATVIGAAMFAFFGVGFYPNIQTAQYQMKPSLQVVNPTSCVSTKKTRSAAMLKGIHPAISPQLLATLSEMGHGDEILFADAHFPAHTFNHNVIRCDGVGVDTLLGGVVELFELDQYVDQPVIMMLAVPGDELDPRVENKYLEAMTVSNVSQEQIERVERFAFYERAKQCYAVVLTGEVAKYGNIILKKVSQLFKEIKG